MISTQEQIKLQENVSSLVEKYFAKKISYSDISSILSSADYQELDKTILRSLIHLLGHYQDDLDIHEKDKEYKDWQENDIRLYLRTLV